jgi:hypothetical protein
MYNSLRLCNPYHSFCLTQVEYLCVNKSPGFTDAGLLQLAEMDLGCLFVYDCGLTDVIRKDGRLILERSKEVRALKVQHTHICWVLLHGCDRSPAAHMLDMYDAVQQDSHATRQRHMHVHAAQRYGAASRRSQLVLAWCQPR